MIRTGGGCGGVFRGNYCLKAKAKERALYQKVEAIIAGQSFLPLEESLP